MGFTDWTINGNVIFKPTTGEWLPRRPLGIQGDNRPVYPPVRSFRMRWVLEAYEDWATIQDFFRAIESSGTNVVTIPAFPTATGQSHAFREYSGTTLSEPTIGPFFETFPRNVVLVINNIPAE